LHNFKEALYYLITDINIFNFTLPIITSRDYVIICNKLICLIIFRIFINFIRIINFVVDFYFLFNFFKLIIIYVMIIIKIKIIIILIIFLFLFIQNLKNLLGVMKLKTPIIIFITNELIIQMIKLIFIVLIITIQIYFWFFER
jgi:hypothetical protein